MLCLAVSVLPICAELWGAMGDAISWSEEQWVAFHRDVTPRLLPTAAVDGRQVRTGVGGLACLQQGLGENRAGASSNCLLGTAAGLLLLSRYFL